MIESLDFQARSTQERLQQIRRQIALGGYDREQLLSEAIAGISSSLEELAVATEELHQQSETLLSTRQGLEWERQRYQNLFNFAPDAYLVTDEQGVIQEINEAAAALLNIRRDFGIGKPLVRYVTPSDHPLIYAQLKWAAQSNLLLVQGSPQRIFSSESGTIVVEDQEVSLQPVNRAAVPTLIALSGEFDRQGKVQLYWLFHDLRASKQAEIQLREMNVALSNAVEGISRLDDQGLYMLANDAYASMTGYTPAEMVGMNWEKTVYPEDLEAVVADYQQMLRTGTVQLEARGIRKDHSVFYKQLYMISAYDEQQKFNGHYCFMKDITDRKAAEQTIREQAALLDIASDAIFVRDLNHNILYWNQGAERLYGWTAPEAIAQSANALLQEDSAQIVAIMSTLLSQSTWRGEIQKVTKTGQDIIVDSRWTLVRDESGQPKSILTVSTDITEKKQLEAQFYQAQRMESLGTLASGIAHDLNNILTPILALAQVIPLQQSNLNLRSQEMLNIIEMSAKRGASMVKQILTFTRGTGEERTTLQVAPILRETIDIIQQTLPTSITIQNYISDSPISQVTANLTQLHQIIMNLCINARDAMPEGGTIMICAENFYVDRLFAQRSLNARIGNYVLITIADTGVGIPTEVRDRIFEPFFTTKAQGKGTGLGLATVLGIVKSYGGFVQVSSDLGQGSQFKVYLPAVEGTVALYSGNPDAAFS